MVWWLWLVAGFAIGIIEVLVPGYIFLGFAVGALAVGVLLWLGLLAVGLSAQLAIFALVSLVAWFVLRATFPGQRGAVKRWERDIND